MSAGLLVMTAVVALSPSQRVKMDLVEWIVVAIFAVLACLGSWFAVAWRNRTEEELAEESATSASLYNEPSISEDALVSRFAVIRRAAAVHLDSTKGKIHFHNCHVPRRLLATAEPWYSCQLKDIQAVHAYRYRGESLTIVTRDGRVLLPETASNYTELKEALKAEVPHNKPGFSRDHPMMGMVYLTGILLGMLAASALCPGNASETTFGLFFLGGAVVGGVCSYLVVALGDQFGLNLAQPIGSAMLGAVFGFGISVVLQPLSGSIWVQGSIVTLATAAGLYLGISRQRR